MLDLGGQYFVFYVVFKSCCLFVGLFYVGQCSFTYFVVALAITYICEDVREKN